MPLPGWLQLHFRKLLWTGAVLVLYALVGFFFLPWFAERQLTSLLQQRLAVDLQLDKLRFNPFTFTLAAEQIHLQSADGPLLDVERLYLNLEPWRLLLLKVRVAEVAIDAPQLYFNRYGAADTTFSRLAQQWAATAAAQASAALAENRTADTVAELFPLELAEFQSRNGSIQYRDTVPQTEFLTTLGPIDLSLTDLSLRASAVQGSKNLSVQLEQGATLTLNGDFSITPLHVSGHLDLAAFSLTTPYRYFQDRLPFDLRSGTLAAGLDYEFSLDAAGPRLQLSKLAARISALDAVAAGSGEPLLSGGTLVLEDGRFGYPDKQAQAAALRISDLTLALQRNQQGVLNWLPLLADLRRMLAAARPEQASATPFQLRVDEATVATSRISFTDQALHNPARLTLQTTASLRNFTLAPDAVMPLTADLQSGAGGSITLQGELQLFPVRNFTAALEVANLTLQPAQPYLDEFAQIDIDGGELDLSARVQRGSDEAFSYQGSARLGNLQLGDRQRAETLLSLAALQVDSVAFSLGGRSLEISEVDIDNLFARVLIDANGETNFASALVSAQEPQAVAEPAEETADELAQEPADEIAQEPAQAPTAEPARRPFAVSLGRLQINNASSDYTDRNLPFEFDTLMTGLNGAISGFSTQSNEPMALSLEGQVGAFGLVEISGALNPLDLARQTQIELDFSNLELPALSPYVIKFAGREIAEGRVDVELVYAVDNGELQASNSAVIRDIRLGKRVDYPGALSLPLDLAVALLKNSAGVIDIEVPVSGNVRDPQFDFGPVVRQAIANVLTSIVTAPFRLLAGLFGGAADEIDTIRFRPGRGDLAPPEREKLQKLLGALAQRPQLALTIPAPFAGAEDSLALQEATLEARIEAQLAADASEAPLLQKRQTALELLYTAAALAPTLAELQVQFTIGAEVAESSETENRETESSEEPVFDALAYSNHLRERLSAAEAVTDEQLQVLAKARQAAVADFLLAGGALAAERLELPAAAAVDMDDGWLSANFDVGVTE